jgi:iron complex outermembrane receptor protein
MNSGNRHLRLVIASLLAVVGSEHAAAQAEQGRGFVLEEIIVTAEKREEKLQDVPVAVSVYSDTLRDIVGIRSVEDVAAFTPGMNFSSLDRLSLRGVGRLTNALGSDPGVATYNDGFYTSSLAEAGKSPLFVDRIEVLRGPQGTLYGRNSMGGAVNIISKRPSRDGFEGEVRGIVGNYDSKHIEASITAPFTDSFRFRLLGQMNKRDEGYFKNESGPDRGRMDRSLMELQLEADLGNSVQWWMKYSTARWTDENSDGAMNGVGIDPYFSGLGVFPPNSLVPSGSFLAATNGRVNPSISDRYRIDENTASSYQLDDNHTVVTHLTFDLGGSELKYIGGYQRYDFKQIADFDGTGITGPLTSFAAAPGVNVPFSVPVYPEYVTEFVDNKRYYSNELNWTSTEGPHKWILGLFQYHEEVENPVSLYAPRQAQIGTPISSVTFAPVAPSPGNRFYFANGDLESDSYAAFGQFDYAINDAWTATLGVRYSKDEKVGVENHRLIYFLPIAPALGGTGGAALDVSPAINSRRLEGDWDNVSGKLGIEWTVSDELNLFVNYNRGYKSGGFNLGTIIGGANPAAATVDEETVDAIEFGWKTNLAQSLQLNGSVFYYLYDNAQVPFGEFRNGIVTTTFRNTDVTSYGFEVESIWAATDNLSFIFNYSYLNAEVSRECEYRGVNDYNDCYYDTADPQALARGANRVGQDAAGNWLQTLDGNQMSQAPENKVAFNTSYRIEMGGAGSLTLSGTYAWQDETGYSLFGNEAYRVDDFASVDARILWNDADDRFTVIGFVDNALDDEGYNGAAVAGATAGATRTWNFTPPRTYGVEVQVRF